MAGSGANRRRAVSRAGAAPNGCSEGPRTDSAQCSRWQGPRENQNTLYKREHSLHGDYHILYRTSTASGLSRPTRHERPAGAGPGGRAPDRRRLAARSRAAFDWPQGGRAAANWLRGGRAVADWLKGGRATPDWLRGDPLDHSAGPAQRKRGQLTGLSPRRGSRGLALGGWWVWP